MKIFLVGGAHDQEIIEVPEDISVTFNPSGDRDSGEYDIYKWAFPVVGWLTLGIHESVREEERLTKIVHSILRPEVAQLLRPVPGKVE